MNSIITAWPTPDTWLAEPRDTLIIALVSGLSRRFAGGRWAARKMWAAGPLMPVPMLALGLCAALGCHFSPRYPRNFESSDPGERIRAIKQAGDRRDRSASPALVQRLEDEDEAVRLFAILALEKIWGTRLGYDYRKPAPERARAVRRWQRHLENSSSATTRPSGGRMAEAFP